MTKATLREMVDQLVEDGEYFGPDGACPTRFEEGANPRVLLITGGNASGKSFACRYLNSIADGEKVEFMRVGMGMRTGSGIPGMQKAMMFGDEGVNSTGIVSGNVIRTGISTCEGRGHAHVLCLDEPDIGMAEETQDAAGQVLARFAQAMPEKTLGLVVVTHSRQIAGRLLALDPIRLRCGDADLRTTEEWVSQGPLAMSIEDYEAQRERAHERRRAIQSVINSRKESRDAPAYR